MVQLDVNPQNGSLARFDIGDAIRSIENYRSCGGFEG